MDFNNIKKSFIRSLFIIMIIFCLVLLHYAVNYLWMVLSPTGQVLMGIVCLFLLLWGVVFLEMRVA